MVTVNSKSQRDTKKLYIIRYYLFYVKIKIKFKVNKSILIPTGRKVCK